MQMGSSEDDPSGNPSASGDCGCNCHYLILGQLEEWTGFFTWLLMRDSLCNHDWTCFSSKARSLSISSACASQYKSLRPSPRCEMPKVTKQLSCPAVTR